MAMSQFPPQAYTRDMLSTAYEWLRSQPQNVRELAKDSDSLVALYMQARRRSESTHTQFVAPSVEHFKQDLKTLAEGLKQFEEPRVNPPTGATTITGFSQQTQTNAFAQSASVSTNFAPPQPAQFHSAPLPASTNPAPIVPPYNPVSHSQPSNYVPPMANSYGPITHPTSNQPNYSSMGGPAPAPTTGVPSHRALPANYPTTPPRENSPLGGLDYSTREKIRSVQMRLNLSHENEALRLLLTLGYEQIQSILPK